ncbi:MAG: recombination mediator RecR, partial [Alphaproteobacteria bacterium]
YLIKNKSYALEPLYQSLLDVSEKVKICHHCGNLDTASECSICVSDRRDAASICVVADVDDLWAMERTGTYKGLYHILGGLLSALDGIGPDQLSIGKLISRLGSGNITEVIIALSATLEGQTTAHYLSDKLKSSSIKVTRIAYGVPVGGELDYLDDGTIAAALKARLPI